MRHAKSQGNRVPVAILLLLSLAWPDFVVAADYYLDNSATGDNNGGPGNDAFQTWAAANAALAALPDSGGGCTLIVKAGTGASYGDIAYNSVLRVTRTDWLTIQAATGETPLFGAIEIRSPSGEDVRDVKVRLRGLRIVGQNYPNSTVLGIWIRNFELIGCNVSTSGVTVPGSAYPTQFNVHAVGFASATDILVSDCNIYDCLRCISLGAYTTVCERVRIEDSLLHRFGNVAVNFQGVDLDLWSCKAYDPNHNLASMTVAGTVTDGPFLEGEIVQQLSTGAQMYVVSSTATSVTGWTYSTTEWVVNEVSRCEGLTSGAYIANGDPDKTHQDLVQIDQGANTYRIDIRNCDFNAQNEGGPDVMQLCLGIKINGKTTVGGVIDDVNIVNCILRSPQARLNLTGVTNLRIWNCLFAAANLWQVTLYQNSSTITELYNNIFLGTTNLWDADSGGKTFRVVGHGNNLWFQAPAPGSATYPYVMDGLNEKADVDFSGSYFADYAGWDYTIVPGSPCIDAGYVAGAPTTDVLGNPRDAMPDIGPYERQSPPAIRKYLLVRK